MIVVSEAAVVADEREGHDHDLTGIAGIGADLLIAGLRCIHDQIATATVGSAKGDATEDGSVLERKQAWAVAADPGVDDGVSGQG